MDSERCDAVPQVYVSVFSPFFNLISRPQIIHLSTQNTDDGELLSVDNPELLRNSSFNPLVPTKIIVHGWLSGEKSKKRGGALLKDGRAAAKMMAATRMIL